MPRLGSLVGLLLLLAANAQAQTNRPPVISVLDFGASPVANKAATTLRNRLRAGGELQVADPDLSRAAARGIGYSGSLNLSVNEARDLGAALATEFFVLGDAQTLRRSSFQQPAGSNPPDRTWWFFHSFP